MVHDPLEDIRVADMVTFLAVARSGSMVAAARQMGVTTSQVSKAVSRLEGQLSASLVHRTPRSIRVTERGHRIANECDELLSRLRALRAGEQESETVVTLAAPSWVIDLLLPAYARDLRELRVRGLERAFPAILSGTSEPELDLFFLDSAVPLPESWVSVEIARLRWGLVASPAVARQLGPCATEAQVREHRFIIPVARDSARLTLTDECPLPIHARKRGHEAESFGVALRLAQTTEHLAFGPLVRARAELEEGSLVHIPVEGWNVNLPLVLCANRDRVLARVQREFLRVTREELGRSQPEGLVTFPIEPLAEDVA